MKEYDYNKRKIIAVINGELSVGLAMNALGHLAFSAGNNSVDEMMGQRRIIDANKNPHVGISRYPFIVLKSDQIDIKRIVSKAKRRGILTIDYTQDMFDTGIDNELIEQLSKNENPEYHAVVLVGNSDELRKLTGHLRLYN